MKDRLLMILIFILLFLGAVLIFGSAIRSVNSPSARPKAKVGQEINLPREGAVFNHSELALKYKDMPEGNRTLDNYYDNRAYPGAPPMIPHPLLSEIGIGGKACLQCHQKGGFVSQFDAYAPVTPHPEWLNCKQCHVPKTSDFLFKKSNWEKPVPPTLGTSALFTSPLIMPHGLQNRENCLSCHAGPSAPKEIKVSHPERINCRQCHVPKNTENIFYTPLEFRNTIFQEDTNSIGVIETIDDSEKEDIKKWMNHKNEEGH